MYLWNYYRYNKHQVSDGQWTHVKNDTPIARLFSAQVFFGTYTIKEFGEKNLFGIDSESFHHFMQKQLHATINPTHDVTLVAPNNVSIRAHKFILIARSPVMRSLLVPSVENDIANLSLEHRQEMTVNYPEQVSKASLATFLEYIYTGTFHRPSTPHFAVPEVL
jgi:hypothetical protein